MLLNLNKSKWSAGLKVNKFDEQEKQNENVVLELKELATKYEKAVVEEDKLTAQELVVKNVGRQDPKKHLSENVQKLMADNIVQTLGVMLDTICF
jgi:26S proteasome regulatory subunit N11